MAERTGFATQRRWGWAETAESFPGLVCWSYYYDRDDAERSKKGLARHLGGDRLRVIEAPAESMYGWLVVSDAR